MSYVVALDVSMGHSYKVLYEEDKCLSENEIMHNQFGFGSLLDEIHRLLEVPQIVFESTGIYSKVVEKFLQDHHLDYCLLNPLEAKKQTEENTLRSWKTDKADAHRLAQSHFKSQRRVKEKPADSYEKIRALARFYQEVEGKIKRFRMDLHNGLQMTFPELELFFTNRVTPYALTLISFYPHPDFVLTSSRTKIKNKLMKESRKKISEKRAWQKADQIIEYAKQSYPATEKESIQCQKTVYYAQLLLELLEQKEILANQMIKKAGELQCFSLYQSIPGIGALTAALLIGELGDITRFPTNKQLNAFVGIDIRRYHSGKHMGQDHINKRGNPKARKIIYFTICNMIRQQCAAPNHIVDYYYKLKKQPLPKKGKVATVACMNKLLKCMHAMVKTHTKYDYAQTALADH